MIDRLRAHAHSLAGGLPRTFWLLCAGMFVNRCGSFVLPFLSIYLTVSRGHSLATAGAVASLYGAGAMLSSLVGGYLADHIGRRATMIAALALGGAGMIALGFAHDIRLIAPATFFVALAGEAYRPAMLAAVSDLVPPAERGRAFGLLYWVINIGFSVGAVLGGAIATVSFVMLFVFDGLTSIAFALVIARFVPETRPTLAQPQHASRPGDRVREFVAPFIDGPFGLFILLSVLILLVFMQHVTAFPIDVTAHGVSRAWLGVVLAVNGVIIVLLQPFLAPVLQRLNRSRVLATGALLMAIGFGLNAVARGPGLYALGVLIWSIGEIHLFPIGNALVADVAPAPMRGRYQGAYGLTFGMAALGAPLIGTATLERFGAPALWIGCLALGLAVAVGHLMLGPSLSRLRRERSTLHADQVIPQGAE
ncbi:MAG TPA: MFS transporter [Candidatus Eisenbacteria bacterium]|nr:MFS transporter [Candidatus Eisenbacteria bacterium]